MDWQDTGTLLTVRPHGETSAIIEVFTPSRGRHAGVVRGGTGRRLAPHLQPGSILALTWRARLEDHIGTFAVEPVRNRSGRLLEDRSALCALDAVTALLAFALPERQPHPDLHRQTEALLDRLGETDWPFAYLHWELALLDEMGFGLDLTACAVTGQADDLVYISPKTGRAVSRAGAGAWADRLLPLPDCLRGGTGGLAEGLRTTGHFLDRHLAAQLGDRPLPEARARLLRALARSDTG